MQIPKFLLMFCVAMLGMSTLQAQRVDTEEQAKARELLRKKMAELDAQQPAVQPQQTTRPVPEPATPPKKTQVRKAAPRPAPVFAPAPTQPLPSRELIGVPPLTPPVKPPPGAESAPAITPPPAVAAPPQARRLPPDAPPTTSAPASTVQTEGATHLTPDAEAKTREELRRKMAELNPSNSASAPNARSKPTAARKKEQKAKQSVSVTPAPSATVESPVPAVVPDSKNQKSAGPVTVQRSNPKQKKSGPYVFDTPAPTAPVENSIPAAVPDSKSQKLAELLARYRSNAITPEEYHKKRAEILAQP